MTLKNKDFDVFIEKNDGTCYGEYYGNGLWGPDKNKYKENLNINGNPLWFTILTFLCVNI
tara:strand:- start:3952 stop:4131 length:180 start_codon:yes stop_codon:yes gene_type:complete